MVMETGRPMRFLLALAAIVLYSPLPNSTAFSQETQTPLAPLLTGVGVYSRPISTESLLAQQYFNQGLNLTYGYYFVHGAASFQEAIRHDPENGMLYWGLALSVSPNPNSRYALLEDDPQGEGKKAIEKAMTLRDSSSPVERDLIQALHVRYDNEKYPDRADRDRSYIEAMRSILQRYPNDLDVGFLLADAIMTASQWSYWDIDRNPKEGTEEAADALTRVLELHPLHPGANHLYIHLVEASNEPGLATPHADRLAALMPHAGHVVHMPSHIFIRTGRYQDAIDTNLRSVEVDKILLDEWGDHPFPMICSYNVSAKSHTGHATDFVRLASMFQGNYERAIEYARITAKTIPIDSVSNRNHRHIATVWLVHKIFGCWDDLEAETAPPEDNPYLYGFWNYVHGSRLVHAGDLAGAEAALTVIQRLRSHPDVQVLPIRANPGKDTLLVAALGLQGEIAIARGEIDAAIESFERAVQAEDALGYMEPQDWAQSMRLYLGQAHLRALKPAKAETVYREDLEQWPENGWALFGLWKSLEAQSRTAEASEVQVRFERAWRNADINLTSSVF